jgi:hypothetical protein
MFGFPGFKFGFRSFYILISLINCFLLGFPSFLFGFPVCPWLDEGFG